MVKTRICIISDTHNAVPKPRNHHYGFREPLPSCDVLLHAGDITMEGELEEYKLALSFLEKADAELKIVIAGNHDTTLDKGYDGPWGPGDTRLERDSLYEDAVEMWTGEEAKRAGIVYLEEEVRSFELKNGARFTIYASPYQPEFCNWAFAYPRKTDRWNPSPDGAPWKAPTPVPDSGIDILMTHGPPRKILDKTMDAIPAGCAHLLTAVERAKPLLHCFGHIHEGNGCLVRNWTMGESSRKSVDKDEAAKDRGGFLDFSADSEDHVKSGQGTIFINAAIMDIRYEPRNSPWVVDLDLPSVDMKVEPTS